MLETLKRIANFFPYCLTIVDVKAPGRPCIFANEMFLENTGFEASEAIGRNLSYLQGELTSQDTIDFMRKCFNHKSACIQDIVNYKKDGSPFLNRLLMIPIVDNNDELLYVGFQHDITKARGLNYNNESLHKVQDQEIRHMVNNPLAIIVGKFDVAFKKAKSPKEIEEVALGLCDKFKRINDFALQIESLSEFEKFDPLG